MPINQYQYQLTAKNSLSNFPGIIPNVTANTLKFTTTTEESNLNATITTVTSSRYNYAAYLANNRI